jgi:YegS/Rv2252/BmrU family lipid kinase
VQVTQEDGLAPPQPKPRTALLILNRKARNGGLSVDAPLAVLERGGIKVEPIGCDTPRSMVETIRSAAGRADLVIVGGGDGTLNCAAAGLVATGLPMGILPLGTANDLARTLGIGADPVRAAEIIVAGHQRQIDLGDVNGRLFFNVASIGFSADLARELTSEAKRRWGTLGYVIASARLLFRTRPFTAFIEHDGETVKVKTVQIAVGNGRHYGGGMTMDPEAEPDDGMFHVYSLEVDRWWHLVALAPALKRGSQATWRDVRAFTASGLTIRTRRTRSVNTDGELTTATPAVFAVRPGAVRVFVPEAEGAES